MPEITTHPANVPSWVDLATPDMDASRAFYGGLFGWDAHPVPEPEAGGYTLMRKRGKDVAALTPPMAPGQPPAWATYINVTDADATAARAEKAGGKVLVPPFDVMTAGRMAAIADPTGAVFCLWQAKTMTGAGLVNDPGSFSWNELQTRSVEPAMEFYSDVFGWKGTTAPMPGMPATYTTYELDGKPVAGMIDVSKLGVPDAMPNYWLVYFTVEDIEAAVRTATEHGATVMMPTMTVPAGTFCILRDPQGAVFAVIQLTGGM